MNILWLIATMFGLFLLEGTAVQLFEPKAWGMDQYSITPRFVLVAVIFIALYLGRRRGLWFGFAFGLMQDILYSDVIGVYAFSMAFTGYFSGLAFLLFHPNLILLLVTIMGCTILHELIVYGFFHLFGIAQAFSETTMWYYALPTVLVNACFAILIYYPFTRMLEAMGEERMRED